MSELKWSFTCPECGGHTIVIEARMNLIVNQDPETGEYETTPSEDGYTYDRDDYAYCVDCEFGEQMKYF